MQKPSEWFPLSQYIYLKKENRKTYILYIYTHEFHVF